MNHFLKFSFLVCFLSSEIVFAHGGEAHSSGPAAMSMTSLTFNGRPTYSPQIYTLGVDSLLSTPGSVQTTHNATQDQPDVGLTAGALFNFSRNLGLAISAGVRNVAGVQDPSLGVSLTVPLLNWNNRWISSVAAAAPASKESQSQARALTINVSTGYQTQIQRFSFGMAFYGGLPIYKQGASASMTGSTEATHADFAADPGHGTTPTPPTTPGGGAMPAGSTAAQAEEHHEAAMPMEKRRVGANMSVGYLASRKVQVSAGVDVRQTDYLDSRKFTTEVLIPRVSYLFENCQISVGLGLRDEHEVMDVPVHFMSRVGFSYFFK